MHSKNVINREIILRPASYQKDTCTKSMDCTIDKNCFEKSYEKDY